MMYLYILLFVKNRNFIVFFVCLFAQLAFAQTLPLDKVDSHLNNGISEHDRAFYEKNTIACIYTDENGMKMPYRLFLPPGYNPNKEYPLLLSLHGAGSRGDDNLKQLRPWIAGWMDEKVQNEYPCIILMPQCPIKKQWVNVPWKEGSYMLKDIPISQPMKLAKEIFDKIVKEESVDKKRIYVMGASMGGYGTWNFVMHYPKLVAAAVPICGAGDPLMVKKIRKIPIWAFHGDKDKVVPLTGSTDMINSLKSLKKNKARVTIYEGVGHNSYARAWKESELIEWLFSQEKHK
ncbi:prolyl oligopeptidase family serine peptidase [Saccharicrinis sp. GN24d3]|uniref:prolyl oligopeptidase family serine peptidase n=1 Tax=Saccharicrinis sp. GN24d3 TaxID=3458416 RepID=UPI004036E42F